MPADSATDAQMMLRALSEAHLGVASGGMPFGAVLTIDNQIVSSAHNRQIQNGDYLAHAELLCLKQYFCNHSSPPRNATLYATEAPCPMCAGAALVSGVTRIVVGEKHHYGGACDWLSQQEVDLIVLDRPDCIDLVTDFRTRHADRWNRYSAG